MNQSTKEDLDTIMTDARRRASMGDGLVPPEPESSNGVNPDDLVSRVERSSPVPRERQRREAAG